MSSLPARGSSLALVAMPWSQKDRPSAALGALSAYVRRERPRWRVDMFSAYLDVAASIGFPAYDTIALDAYRTGEMVYASLFYPERTDRVRRMYAASREAPADAERKMADRKQLPDFDALTGALAKHVEALVEALAGYQVVGLTTSFGQLFANLVLARALKKRSPGTAILLGGSTVSSRVGPSILREYPFVDAIIQGEGELPLTALLGALERGDATPAAPGILARTELAPAPLSEVQSMDDLPIPEFDEYAERATRMGVFWSLPIEGSRGCWWDRTRRAANPKSTCYFCNLNVQWGGYREKSPKRVARELAVLADRYENLRAYFIDNVQRHTGLDELADGILATGKQFDIFHEMRANVRSVDFVRFWEAGLTMTQFGIEGLSTSFLRRIGKGTTVLQNLQAMRLCTEFNVHNAANLILDFPGATQEEVDETVRTIEGSALSYEPLELSIFGLGVDSSLDALRTQFGVVKVRNSDKYRVGLPEDVWERLELFDLSFDLERRGVDWGPVREARRRWLALHEKLAAGGGSARGGLRLLTYADGGGFIEISDYRSGEVRMGTFEGAARDIYLTCLEISSFDQLARKYAEHDIGPDDARDVLQHFVRNRIMHEENDRYLSLAVARSPAIAAARIRAAWREREASRRPERARLPMAV